jgi:chromosome segregation ATPase
VSELVKALGIAPSRAERRQSTGKLQPFTGGGSGVARANLEIAALRGSARWSAFAGRLKKQILELLEKDLEFRYAVAGYLGLSEVLRRLDSIEESIKKLWESQNRLWENASKLWEEVKLLREGQEKLWENQGKLWEEVKALREGQEKLWLEVKALREGQDRLWEEVGALNVRVARVERTLEKLTLDVEEEARIVVERRLR